MSRNAVETVIGAVVLVVAALFLFFAYTTTQVRAVSGYDITARFTAADGLRDGSDVRLSGIKVGSVVSQTLDPKTFMAVVKMSIDPNIKLPVDTAAQITSASLLGDDYLSLIPGNEDKTIPPGGEIQHTTPSMNIGSMIGQYIFGGGGGGQQQKSGGAAAAPKP